MNTSVTFSGDQEQTQAGRPDQEKQTPAVDTEAIAKMLDEKLSKFADEFGRKQQSLRRKQEDRVRSEVQRQLETLRNTGVEVNSEQAKALETHIRNSLEDQSEPAEEPAPQKKQADKSSVAFINQAAEAIWDEFGLTVTDEDPEVKLVITDKSPKEFLSSVRKAALAKQERLNVPPDVKMPTMQGGGQTSGNESDYIKEMLANRGNGYAVMNQIKGKYRDLGVNVDQVSLTNK